MRYTVEPVTCDERKAGGFTTDFRRALDLAFRMAKKNALSFAVYDQDGNAVAFADQAVAQ